MAMKVSLQCIVCRNGKTITYDYLVMATGIKPDWEKIEGLKEALDDPKCPVASIYDFHHSEKVDRFLHLIFKWHKTLAEG